MKAAGWLLLAGLAALPPSGVAWGQTLPPTHIPMGSGTNTVWRVEGGGGLAHFLAGLTSAAQRHDAACAALQQAPLDGLPETGQLWLRAGGGQVRLLQTNEQGLDRLDTPWARAALAAAAVAERLGSLTVPLDIWLRWQDDTYSVGTRSQAGQQYRDPCLALGQVVNLLLAANQPGLGDPASPKTPHPAVGDGPLATQILAIGRLLARQSVLIGRGNVVTIGLDSLPFANQPTLVATPGVTIQYLRQQDGRWLVDLAVTPTATQHSATLAVFAPGQRFQPIYTIPLTIVAGENSGATDTTNQTAQALQIGQTISGHVAANSAALHTLEITQQSQIIIRSDGNSDVQASLLDAAGNTIATDDDSAGHYHFMISSSLAAGKYWLRVEHCCKQAATYSVQINKE